MTVAMALAERTHHSSRGQTIARAGVWGHELNHMATIRDPPTPQPELFELSFEEEPGGARPDRLSEVRPQNRDLRRTVDQIGDAVPGFPALDVLVPQMVDQPVVLLAAFDVLVPEQVIELPKMSTPTRCPRTVLSVPQTAEQLVEFPNVVSLIDVLRHPVEQTVGGGRIGGLPGFSQDRVIPFLRSRSLTIQFLVVVLVEVFMVHTQDRVLQRFMEQIIPLQRLPSRTLTFQFRVVRLMIFIKILFLQLVLQICWKQQIKGFFSTFPRRKKSAKIPRTQGSELGADFSSWPP